MSSQTSCQIPEHRTSVMVEPLHRRFITTERLADELEKPTLDERTYRVIQLLNNLEVLLIHDYDTDRAAAAMDVHMGSLADPPEMQGMAHAVEHTLFMGTEKFPEENNYNAYLAKYNGHGNPFTSMTSTNFYFQLSVASTSDSLHGSTNASGVYLGRHRNLTPLYGAIDLFSQFFIKPLFQEVTIDRELRVVDSENPKHF